MKDKCNDIERQNLFSMLLEKIKLTVYHGTKLKIMCEELRVVAKETEKRYCVMDSANMEDYRM
jgi:hypothetical protein